jgi:hypothetical protein
MEDGWWGPEFPSICNICRKALLSYGYLTSLAANFSRAELSAVVVLELARLGPGQRDSRTGPRYV